MPSFAPAPPLVAPAASSPATLTWGGSAWVSGAWVQLLAAAASASALCAVSILSENIAAPSFDQAVEIDIGVGGSGSEVVIATVKFRRGIGGPTQYVLPVPVAAIPAGGRVAARIRATAASTIAAAVGYVPTGEGLITTTQALKVVPAAADVLHLTTSVTPWAWSAWGEIVGAAASAWVLAGIGVASFPSPYPGEWELEIGVGASGSEVAVARIAGNAGISHGGPTIGATLPVAQAGVIGAGARVSARIRSSLSAAHDAGVHLAYYEAPL